jgi:hypothetical protein
LITSFYGGDWAARRRDGVIYCIHTPHQHGPREDFYWDLFSIELPSRSRLLVGGDFNCTLDPRLDRSHFRERSGHESTALGALLTRWGLVDAISLPEKRTEQRLREFYEQTHTDRYMLPSGKEASARLDRWYTSVDMVDMVAQVEVRHPGARADHQAVRLHLVNRQDPIRILKPARIYPPPNIAVEQVTAATRKRLEDFHDWKSGCHDTRDRMGEHEDGHSGGNAAHHQTAEENCTSHL